MKLKDVKLTFSFLAKGASYHGNRYVICTCGYKGEQKEHRCPTCGGSAHLKVIERNWAKTSIGMYDLDVEKSDDGFYVIKTKICAKFNEDITKMELYKGSEQHVFFSIRNRAFRAYVLNKDGEEDRISLESFFRNINEKDFIELVSTERSKQLYNLAKNKYGKQAYERSYIFYRGLKRLMDKLDYLEVFYNMGFKSMRAINNHEYYIDRTKTKPHEMLGVPKYTLKYLKDQTTFHNLKPLNILEDVIGGNNLKLICEIFYEENNFNGIFNIYSDLVDLYQHYGYTDIKKLVLYLVRDVKLQQGIISPSTAATQLRDYVRMSKTMGVEYNKFTKNLKKDHDVTQMNYEVRSNEYKSNRFTEVISYPEYQKLKYKHGVYAIVTPKVVDDLINEGESLGHCVASYVDDVIDEKCKIYFLRYSDKLDESLVTIEVRDGNIRQVRGKGNRTPTPIELEFVKEWSEKKELRIAIH